MININDEPINVINAITKSKFRSRFHLDKKDVEYINKNGFVKIEEHTLKFLNERLKPAQPKNDTKQTPYKGHPTFKAMHALGFCCRHCLNKIYGYPLGVEIDESYIIVIKNIIMAYIKEEYERINKEMIQ